MRNTSLLAVLAATILLAAAANSGAGVRWDEDYVYLRTWGGTAPGGTASGSLGDVRNSSDNVQYIGCMIRGEYSPPLAICTARNQAGVDGTCVTTNAGMVANARAVGSDSLIRFDWDSGGNCTRMTVWHNSYFGPKQ